MTGANRAAQASADASPTGQVSGSALAPPPLQRHHALFLDVDGTLFEFSVDPAQTRASPAELDVLDRIGASLGGALALVSGRNLDTLDRIFAPVAHVACGLHGLQLRGVERLEPTAAPAPSRAFAQVVEDAKRVLGATEGVLVEDKQGALGLHWRGAPGQASRLRAFAEGAIARLDGYELQSGNHVIEIRPTGADKGNAIATFMQAAPFAGRVPVFVGDDLTDEAGFAVVNAAGGISVLVGDRQGSAARYRLASPASVWAWLEAAA